MSLKVQECSLVCPVGETPNQIVRLSRLDMLALSRALVSFYPLAGRLRKNESNDEIEVDCNAEGALFIEVETPYALNDFVDGDGDKDGVFKPNAKFRKMSSKPQINALKLEAASHKVVDQGYTLSTFKVVAGHVWRSTCMVRGLANEQYVKLYIPIDARTRLKDPTLLKGYYGNLVFFAACIAEVVDIVSKPLWFTASKIHETLERMQDVEYLKSAVDCLESNPIPWLFFVGQTVLLVQIF
ncbi:anthranilate N-benzoyltransferase protein 2-like [Chenopodium quinoa]|uniref:anthranilate N-benzoyltransferase protein 2-like n=1 Tax=Chenopodium quinoa TaxID=63459 RepID=UPI000B79344C|nr:anthranilate N-benzoyltransferase protein 2-like [Chenopodium quinoa]